MLRLLFDDTIYVLCLSAVVKTKQHTHTHTHSRSHSRTNHYYIQFSDIIKLAVERRAVHICKL